MGSFSIWHWIVVGVVLAWIVIRLTRRRLTRREPELEVRRAPRRRSASHAQLDFIEDLCAELGRDLPPGFETLNRVEASLLIDQLKDDLKDERRRG